MANIPTKRLARLYEKALAHAGTTVKDREFELLISESFDYVQLVHYGTVIYRNRAGTVNICGAFSVTDRDYINGLIMLMGVSGHAYIKNHILYYHDENGIQKADMNRYGYSVNGVE